MLAGPTYIERLWCIVEVFTFTRMGGELSRIEITPFGDVTAAVFAHFAVEQAKCFKGEDKARLLTAIEAAFGAYGPFNALVRSLLISASSGEAAAVEVSKLQMPKAGKRDAKRQPGSIVV